MVDQQSRPRPRWLVLGLALSLGVTILSATFLLWVTAGRNAATELPDLATMPAFQLTDQEGLTVTADQYRGKVLLVGFIYTNCDDICPMLTAQMRSLQEDLQSAGLLGEAQLLSISVDPEVDTPAVLREYAAGYGVDTTTWRFLTGEVDHVRKVVVEGFLLGYQQVPAAGGHAGHGGTTDTADYRVEHSGRIALVDQAGTIRAYYDGTELDRERVIREVRTLVTKAR